MKRIKTDYVGVYYREVKRSGLKAVDRVYYVTFKRDGKLIEAKAGSQLKNDMTPARASNYRADLIRGKDETPAERREKEKAEKLALAEAWTINKLWDSYCQAYPDKKSIKNENVKFEKHLRPGIGKMDPSELTVGDVDDLRTTLQKNGKATTAARVLELLRRTLNFGIKRGHVPPLAFKVEVPRLNNQRTEDLTPEQLKKLKEVLDKEEDQVAANVMRLALVTGMRKSEIFKLKWSDLDFQRGFISLRDPKGGTDQKVPLNDSARAIFNSIERTDTHVFPGRGPDGHQENAKRSFERIVKDAGLPAGFRPLHGLRHVYASTLASSGQVDLYTLQRLLTHKSPMMTQRYAHLRDEALRKASNLAGDIFNKIGEQDNGQKDG